MGKCTMELFTTCIRNIGKRVYLENSSSLGFTLIELLVVIGMLAVLMLGLIFTFNPQEQFNKAKDAQREHDLAQIQRALDTYFNDTGCYPISLTFGSVWKSATGAVYMEKVPQDTDCSANPTKCYIYQVPSGSCPQWNVLYASLRSSAIPVNACPLVIRNTSTACLPANYGVISGYNYCVASGLFDCTVIAGSTIFGSGGGSGGGGSGGGGSSTPTPTPTPGMLLCTGGNYYGCSAAGGNTTRCNSESPPQNNCIGYGGTIQCYCDSHCNQSCTYN